MQNPLSLFFHHVNVCHTAAAFGPLNTVIKIVVTMLFPLMYCAYAHWVTAIIIYDKCLGSTPSHVTLCKNAEENAEENIIISEVLLPFDRVDQCVPLCETVD